uniref:NADH dehydrogenase subunit 3 n=1 Tax=Pseudochoutagus curvativus TaxID=3081119 RepID=UPI002A7F8C5A|nr:NADH dehydrogenase subunit 3 [Pseudochoutagus curvativus]WOW98898.1 NADH dehydrogenase subunit 3 [Pseudochoutagus curvativus]
MVILTTTLIMVMISSTVFLLTTLMSKKNKMSREKNSPFECGFSPMSSPRKPFSIQFFLMATIFLIFDIEISIMLPMAITKMSNMQEWILSTSMTTIILMMGLINEWKNGMLEWTK